MKHLALALGFLLSMNVTDTRLCYPSVQVPSLEPELLLKNLQSGGPKHCVVLMAAAGHFAGAIFQG